jgi:hypothetical protein
MKPDELRRLAEEAAKRLAMPVTFTGDRFEAFTLGVSQAIQLAGQLLEWGKPDDSKREPSNSGGHPDKGGRA